MNAFAQLLNRRYDHDFFEVLRQIDRESALLPRFGTATTPREEPISLGQTPWLSFPATAISRFIPAPVAVPAGVKTKPRLEVFFFGLLGPQGPMPLELTAEVYYRCLRDSNESVSRFLDIFNHRFLSFLYRVWAKSRPVISLDRPQEDTFSTFPAAMIRLDQRNNLAPNDFTAHFPELYFSSLLMRRTRGADGLKAILQTYFGVPVRIEEYVGHWLEIERGERTRIGAVKQYNRLGKGSIIGTHVWDRQSKFRVCLGPLKLDELKRFLPHTERYKKLLEWIKFYIRGELSFDVKLEIADKEIPPKAHIGAGQLGWTAWLGRPTTAMNHGPVLT